MRRPRSPSAPGSSHGRPKGFGRASPGISSDARVTPPCGPSSRSPDLVQPDHRSEIAGVAERLEVVVPRLAECEAQLAVQLHGIVARDLHRVPDAVLWHDDVARRVGLGEEDAELGRVHPPGPVRSGRGILAHLEPKLLPASKGRRELGSAPGLALPVELGAHETAIYRLLRPIEVHGTAERATCCPLHMRAQRPRRGMHEQHASRGARSPRDLLRHLRLRSRGASSPTTSGPPDSGCSIVDGMPSWAIMPRIRAQDNRDSQARARLATAALRKQYAQ
jgi:hypothetical protein